ncbi:MAG: tetratricopeptide repeat protein [Cyclobacteriaceae bacterium]
MSSRKLGDSLLVADFLFRIGNGLFYYEEKYLEAIEYYTRSFKLYERLGSKKTLQCLLKIDACHWYLKDYVQSFQVAQKGLKLAETFGDKEMTANFLNSLGLFYRNSGDLPKSISTLEECLKIYQEIEDTGGIAMVLNNLGEFNNQLGEKDLAIELFHRAIKAALESQENYQAALAFANIGWVYTEQNLLDSASYYLDLSKSFFQKEEMFADMIIVDWAAGDILLEKGRLSNALDLYFDALKVAENLKDTSNIATIYSKLADVFQAQGHSREALIYLKKGLNLHQMMGKTWDLAWIRGSVAEITRKQGEYHDALNYAIQSLKGFQQVGDSCQVGKCYLIIGSTYSGLQQFDSALYYLQIAQKRTDKCSESTDLSLINLEMGKVYQSQNKTNKAIDAYERSIKHATPIQYREALKEAAQRLHPIYEDQDQFSKAYDALKIFHANYDSIFNEANTRSLAQKELQYEYEKEKQAQALIQKQLQADQEQRLLIQTYLTYGFIAAFVLMLALALAVYRNFHNKKKANQLLSQQNHEIEAQRAQLQSQKEELQELDRFKSRFFTNISHELRTPLTLIAGPLEELLNRNLTKDVHHVLQMAVRNTKKLRGLVDDILDLSKITSSKLVVSPEPVHIESLISRIASNYESMAAQLEIQFAWEIISQLPKWLPLDINRTEKVLNNLLFNAIKYTESGGEIKLLVSQEEDKLKVEVIDTGQGIAEADLPHIFDRYFQSKQPDAPLQGGTGIGLALSQELATLMGGGLTVESELGKGSTFTLTLPLKTAEASDAERQLTAAPSAGTEDAYEVLPAPQYQVNKGPKILFVEDNTDMQEYVSDMLSKYYSVTLASNGKKALEILEKQEVDLLISDVMMPEMDGYALVEAIKRQDKFRHIPIVMLTALNFEDRKLQALAIGVDDYLTKPFSPSELMARVENLITRQVARKAWASEAAAQDAEVAEAGSELTLEDYNIFYKADHDWLKRFETQVKEQLNKGMFDLDELADQSHVSKRQLQRKLKKLTGMTPKQYHQEVALQRARMYLEDDTYGNVTAVGLAVGMSNPSRFSELYLQRFGKKPAEYFLHHSD